MSERRIITCRELIEFIIDYVEGTLDEMAQHDFERHLSLCRSCVAYLASYRETMSLTRILVTDEPLDDVPEDLVVTILARRTT